MPTEPTLALIADSLRNEQRRRWYEGDRAPVETYLDAYPSVQADTERALELVYNEVVLREELGETPLLQEYLHRFPRFEQRLRLLFEVHQGLDLAELAGADESSTLMREAGVGPVPATNATQPAIPGYEIVRELGRGGMGVVYLARQIGLNRLAAVKMILAGDYAGDRELARFRTEVEAVGSLQHVNVVQIY